MDSLGPLRRFLVAPFVVLLAGCGAGLLTVPAALRLATVTGAAYTWPMYCKELQLSVVDYSGAAREVVEDTAVALTTSGGTAAWYSDERCSVAVTAATVRAGTSAATLFFRADTAATTSASATSGALDPAALSIEAKAPAPDLALGQLNLTAVLLNQGGGAGASTLAQPTSASLEGSLLAVSDSLNSRVLLYAPTPPATGAKAEVVVGQNDLTSDSCNNGAKGPNASTLCLPESAVLAGNRLIVADQGNNRVLIWNSIPTTNFAPADVVVGQPDMISDAADNGGVSAQSLDTPKSVATDGKALVVADYGNFRVLIWNAIPTTSNAPADVVLGQVLMTDSNMPPVTPTASTMESPLYVRIDHGKLIVSDCCDNRVMIWNSLPTTNNAPADLVLGQPDLTSAGVGTGLAQMDGPGEAVWTGRHFIVADNGNDRLLFWNGFPTATGAAAAFSVDSLARGVTASASAFWITEELNHRVLRFPRP